MCFLQSPALRYVFILSLLICRIHSCAQMMLIHPLERK